VKYFADFVSFLSVAWATAMACKHRLPWTVWSYLAAQSVFTLCAWWVAQGASNRVYRAMFHTLGIVLVLALVRTIAWPMSFWNLGLFPSLFFAVLFAGFRIWWPLKPLLTEREQERLLIPLVYGGIFLFCGFIAILALVERLEPTIRWSSLALGINWIAQGIFAWVLVGNRGKLMVRDVDLNEFIPQFVAIICFSWLAVAYGGAQPESARQHSTDELALSECHILEAQ
jgi:hypothetical protein